MTREHARTFYLRWTPAVTVGVMVFAAFSPHAQARFEETPILDMFHAIPKANPLARDWERFFKQAQPGGTLTIGTDYPLESLHVYSFIDGKPAPKRPPVLDGFVYETLMIEDVSSIEHSVLRPHLAERVELERETNTLQITLHPQAHFSDGEAILAKHVIKSWPLNRNALWTSMFEDLYGKDVELTEISERVLRIRFPTLDRKLFRRAAYYILSDLRIVKANPQLNTITSQTLLQKYIGSGPYSLRSASRHQVELVRDSKYWANENPLLQGQFNFAAIKVKSYMDPIVVRLGLTRMETNFFRELNPTYLGWMDNQAARKGLKKQKQTVNYVLPDGSARALYMNTDRAHLKHLGFRQAMVLAWEPKIAEQVFGDLRETPSSPGALSPLRPQGAPQSEVRAVLESLGDPLIKETLRPYEDMGFEALARIEGTRNRLKAATEFLRQEGYRILQKNGESRLFYNDQPVKLKMISVTDRPDNRRIQLFAENLKKLGIETELRFFPDTSAAFKALQSGDYDFFPAGISIHKDFRILNITYLRQSLHSSSIGGGPNRSHLRSKAVDRLLEKLGETEASSPEYPILIDALLRTVSAYVPFVLLGEPSQSFIYTDANLCLFPEVRAEELHKNNLSLRTGFFSPDGRCP